MKAARVATAICRNGKPLRRSSRVRDRTVFDPLPTNWGDGSPSDDPAYDIVRRLLEDAGNVRSRYEKLIARKAKDAAKKARKRARAEDLGLQASFPKDPA